MKRKLLNLPGILFVLLLAQIVSDGSATAGWTESAHRITEMRIQPGYAWVRLDTTENVVIDQTCDLFGNWFVIDENVNSQFDHIVASAVTAMTVGRRVRILSAGCGANSPATYPRIDILWLKND